MKGFEELLKLDPNDVVNRTFISVDEFNAIKEKRFELFSKPKAAGFIKILEREYDLDLSDWVREFNSSNEDLTKTKENIFVTPPPEETPLLDNKFYLALVAFVIVSFAVFFIFYPNDNKEDIADRDNQMVEEATEVIKNNDIKEYEINSSSLGEVNSSLPAEETQQLPLPQEALKSDVFTLLPQKTMWIGIKYLDNNKNESFTTKDIVELNASREQIITLGHGFFTLTLNDQIIEPKSKNIHKITYKDKKISVTKGTMAKKTTKTEQSMVEKKENVH